MTHSIFTHECLDCKTIQQVHGTGLCLIHKEALFKFRAYIKQHMRKWRKANPEKAKELSKKHQQIWRNKHPDLNRMRARLGMQKLKERLKNGSRITSIH